MLKRYLEESIINTLNPGKVTVLYGPRRVGKTTLMNKIRHIVGEEKVLFLNGEERPTREWLNSQSSSVFSNYLGDYKYVFIDEAQNVDSIGLNLKIIVDTFSDISVFATGSSSFELANQVGEPLVGRKWQYLLYPLAQMELKTKEDFGKTRELLPIRLVFGGYPEVIMVADISSKIQVLNSIVDFNLFKDLLSLEDIKKSDKLLDLLKLIAFQIGSEVSISELSNKLNLSFHTVERYLDLLEKVFVIFKVRGFSRNLRNEITKNSRFYFYDLGVRNAIINNFNDLNTRNDVGQLWENYLFVERMKMRHYTNLFANQYFWRTYDQKEIDLIEERSGKYFGYEFKWTKGKISTRASKEFLSAYDNSEVKVINKDNYLEFIT